MVLILVFVQVLINVQTAYLPGLKQWLDEKWSQHLAAIAEAAQAQQQAQQHAAQVKAQMAIEQQCLSFLEPADKVVWEEDPDRAAKLLATSWYASIPFSHDDFHAPRGACRTFSLSYSLKQSPNYAEDSTPVPNDATQVFFHGRKSASGNERLVIVSMSGSINYPNGYDMTSAWDAEVEKKQVFTAAALHLEAGEDLMSIPLTGSRLELHPSSAMLKMPLHWTPSPTPEQPGRVRIDYKDQLRIFAGQPDPTDASHFTIAYELDGVPGTIDGWLFDDDSVRLKPRVGKVLGNQWYPRAK